MKINPEIKFTIISILSFITQCIVLFGGIYLICKDARPDDGEFFTRLLAVIGFLAIYYHARDWLIGLRDNEWKVEEEESQDD